MAISEREANERRDKILDRAVWMHYEYQPGSRRCEICGERFYDGYLIGEENVCKECHEEQMRLVARYLNPLYADRFEKLIKDEAIKL